jgi:peptidoglycan/LPS O-acetylase OafA/YrhL
MTKASAVGGAPGKGHGRIDDIEVLRGVAVIFVLIEHARINLFPWIGGAETRLYTYFGFWSGVDLFFAISGFVIARSLLPTLATKTDAVAFFNAAIAFWVRRAWRLLPSAWLWLAIILAASAFFNRAGAFWPFRANLEGAVAAVLDVANFRIMTVFRAADPGASFHYWSLSLEEQFYIALPFLAYALRQRLPYLLAFVVVGQFFVTRAGPDTTKLGLILNQLRTDAISLGVLIAIWSEHPTYRLFEPTMLAKPRLLGVTALVLLVFLLAAASTQALDLVPFQIGLVAVISAVLVLIASYDRDYLCPDGPFKPFMLWVGSRSYALYLIHIPAYFLAREIWFRIEPPGTVFDAAYGLRFLLTGGALLVSLTELNYQFVELPLRSRGARIAQTLSGRVQRQRRVPVEA